MIEGEPRLVILGLHVPGAHAELKPTVGQKIHRRGLARDQHGVAEVIVQHVRADLEALRRLGGGDERRHRGEDVSEVIGYGQRGVAEILELAGLVCPLGPRGRAPNIHAEPERLHRQDNLGAHTSAFNDVARVRGSPPERDRRSSAKYAGRRSPASPSGGHRFGAAGVAAADVGDSPGLAPELLRCALARTSPQRWPVELDDVGGVNEPVADRVGKRGLPDHVMPDLTGS